MFVCPVYSQDGRSWSIAVSHVSLPNSPSCGTVRKIHTCSPVRTSKPRTSPGAASFMAGCCGLTMSRTDDPSTTTSLTTIGGEPQPKVSTSR